MHSPDPPGRGGEAAVRVVAVAGVGDLVWSLWLRVTVVPLVVTLVRLPEASQHPMLGGCRGRRLDRFAEIESRPLIPAQAAGRVAARASGGLAVNCEPSVGGEELPAIRTCVTRGRPFGHEGCVRQVCDALGSGFTLRNRGRPKAAAAQVQEP
jgi:hypothetical protein